MLAIRFQRVGRKGHAEFRVVVQDARLTPSSGRVVARIGHYNPHTKVAVIDTEKATYYLGNGAQPSERAASLLQKEGVELPSWVKISANKSGGVKNADKLRRNRPVEEAAESSTEPAEAATTEPVAPKTTEA